MAITITTELSGPSAPVNLPGTAMLRSRMKTVSGPSELVQVSYELDQGHDVHFRDGGALVKSVTFHGVHIANTATPVNHQVNLESTLVHSPMVAVDVIMTAQGQTGAPQMSMCTVLIA